MGASVFWPNKDTQADEPDSQRFAVTVPSDLVDVSNGRLRSTTENGDGTTTYEWFVTNPINNYAITVAAGNYAHFADSIVGEQGTLTLDFWPLDYHLDAARRQFQQAKTTLACFEHWFGPYPWYEDGFKLIETPHPGMEHQSAVAYGNGYANGYLGRDFSGTGIGFDFDFIIVHETAHEWWGNNISTKDLADMWVHEGFGHYAENLYVECQWGKEAGARYEIGMREGIGNEEPIVPAADGAPAYRVNAQGSGDMYPKGGNMLHTIRQIVGDDDQWREILRGLNATFRHQTVMSSDIESYLSREAGRDLSKVFDQYLRTIMIPAFEYRIEGKKLSYRWADVVPGFDMPVDVTVGGETMRIQPTESWQTLEVEVEDPEDFQVDPDYYVLPRDDIRRGARRKSRDPLGRARARPPFRLVHALHEKPEAERALPEERGEHAYREQESREAWREDQREHVDQIARARDQHQYADGPRQIARPEDQNPQDQTLESEEDQADAEPVSVRRRREVREGVDLRRIERSRQAGVRQREQRQQELELVRGFDRDRSQIEEDRKEREVPADRPEQDVEDERQRDGADEHDDLARDPDPPQPLVRQDPLGRRPRVVGHDEPASDECLAEGSAENDEQVERATDPCQGSWRRSRSGKFLDHAVGHDAPPGAPWWNPVDDPAHAPVYGGEGGAVSGGGCREEADPARKSYNVPIGETANGRYPCSSVTTA